MTSSKEVLKQLNEIENKEIGKRIRNIRLSLNKNQKEFADMIDATVSAVSNWERGRNKPHAIFQNKIACLGDMTVDTLMGKENAETYYAVFFEDHFFNIAKVFIGKTAISLSDFNNYKSAINDMDSNKYNSEAFKNTVKCIFFTLAKQDIQNNIFTKNRAFEYLYDAITISYLLNKNAIPQYLIESTLKNISTLKKVKQSYPSDSLEALQFDSAIESAKKYLKDLVFSMDNGQDSLMLEYISNL